MSELFTRISEQLTQFWEKFDKKQKIKMFVILGIVIAVLSTVIFVLTRPSWVILSSDLSTKDGASVTQVLKENNIAYKTENEGRVIKVEESKLTSAKYQLAQSNIPKSGFTYEDAFKTSMSDTKDIRDEKIKKMHENEIARILSEIEGISSANVKLVIPDYDRLYMDSQRESSAAVMIHTTKDFNKSQIQAIVNLVQASVEKLKPENITVLDQNSNALYNGEETNGSTVTFSERYEIEEKKKADIIHQLQVLLGNQFDEVTVLPNLVMDFTEYEESKETHSSPIEGSKTGLVTTESKHSQSSTNSDGGSAPGIDSNPGETTYQSSGNTNSQNKSESSDKQYIYNTTQSQQKKSVGDILYDQSSLTVNLFKYQPYYQETLTKNGTLEGTTWEEFKQKNSEYTDFEVKENIVEAIKSGTGIKNVTVLGVNKPIFVDTVEETKGIFDYLNFIVVIIIMLLLAYVVYKGTEPVEITEIEPELSVDELLSKNIDDDVEEIIDDDRSAIRKEIERFVDEKPEAAAQLLRNWLNEDWE